jgi:hypothetical protein
MVVFEICIFQINLGKECEEDAHKFCPGILKKCTGNFHCTTQCLSDHSPHVRPETLLLKRLQLGVRAEGREDLLDVDLHGLAGETIKSTPPASLGVARRSPRRRGGVARGCGILPQASAAHEAEMTD